MTLDPSTPTAPTRLGRTAVGTLVFTIAAPMIMSGIGFILGASLPGHAGDRAGYTALALAFVGAPVGAVVGFVVSFLGTPERARRRWWFTALAFAVAGAVFATISATGH